MTNLLSNLTVENIIIDEGTCVSFEFELGKLYGFKRPRFYSTQNATMTFYRAESLFTNTQIPSTKQTVFFINKKNIMLYIGHLRSELVNKAPYINNITKSIPCFLYNNILMVPEPFIVNNPALFFIQK